MTESAPEINRYRKDARVRQVNCILDQAQRNADQGSDSLEEEHKSLQMLLFTRPVFLDLQLKESMESKEDFYSKAGVALKYLLTNFLTLAHLKMLVQTCEQDGIDIQRIPLDYETSTIYESMPDGILFAFKNRETLLNNIFDEGVKSASTQVLDLIQGKSPLMRYRWDIAKKIIPDFSVENQCQVGRIPTKVEGVELELYYPHERKFPGMFLSVRSLNQ